MLTAVIPLWVRQEYIIICFLPHILGKQHFKKKYKSVNFYMQEAQNKPGIGDSWSRSALCWSESEQSAVSWSCSLLLWRLAPPVLLLLLLLLWARDTSSFCLSGTSCRHNTLLPLGRTSRWDTGEARQTRKQSQDLDHTRTMYVPITCIELHIGWKWFVNHSILFRFILYIVFQLFLHWGCKM